MSSFVVRFVALCLLSGVCSTTVSAQQTRVFGGVTYGPAVTILPPGYITGIRGVPVVNGFGVLPFYGPTAVGPLSYVHTVPVVVVDPWVPVNPQPLIGPLYSGYSDDSSAPLPSRFGQVDIPPAPHAAPRPAPEANVNFGGRFVLNDPFAVRLPAREDNWKRVLEQAAKGPIDRDEFAWSNAGNDVGAPLDERQQQEFDRVLSNGDAALQVNQVELARAYYQSAVTAAPGNSQACLRLAIAQLLLQDFETAASTLNRALVLSEKDDNIPLRLPELSENGLDGVNDASLWEWVCQRPQSVDRVRLAALRQAICGEVSSAGDLLDLAVTMDNSSATTGLQALLIADDD